MDKSKAGFGTRAIHAGQAPDEQTGAVMTPVYQTSTYAQESPGVVKGHEYSRTTNPTRDNYEGCLAALEDAKYAAAFASGVAATTAIIHTLNAGDHVVCSDDVYGGTFRLFDKVFKRQGIDFTFVDMTDFEATEAAFKSNTKLVWIESPTNPLLKIVDIKRLADLSKSKGVKVAVDNTFMSPFFQKPLALGADMVVHSVTKFLNGHSDVIGGAVMTNDSKLDEDLKFIRNCTGGVPAPWDSFLVMRGIKTLHVRMERHQTNAFKIARHLEQHKRVSRVLYPGLPSHPQHDLAGKQMRGFGGMITFFIDGGLSAAKTFLERVELFTLAESLGGVESLIEHPAIMTHASVPPENRKALGITDDLIRISVGIEEVNDLLQDLDNALKS